MKLETALDEYGLLERRRRRGEEGQRTALALGALREYLVDHSGIEETERLSSNDLFSFLMEYYPSQEEPDPAVGLALLEVSSGFAGWLLERGERSLADFARASGRLREDLPRVMEALALLQEHARRDDLGGTVPVSEEEEEGEVGEMTSGLDRVVSLDQMDYTAAQLDYFTLEQISSQQSAIGSQSGLPIPNASLSLRSSSRDVLKEGVASPVRVPAQAAALLRPGDILYAEIAPGPAGWELLDVFGLRPGGYE